jgi:hypothetical protein
VALLETVGRAAQVWPLPGGADLLVDGREGRQRFAARPWLIQSAASEVAARSRQMSARWRFAIASAPR